jgi:hypothetical protein
MKKILLLLIIALTFIKNTEAQPDPQLVERLNADLKSTQVMDLDKLMDYTYPKLFTIVKKEQIIEAMKEVYETDEFTTTLDSITIDTIYPAFKIKDAEYVKIKHTMLMKMKFKEPFDTTDAKDTDMMIKLMEEEFGEGKVKFDKLNNSINVMMIPDMVGIKDEYAKEWCFVNLDEDNPIMLNMLFSPEVISKLKEYK